MNRIQPTTIATLLFALLLFSATSCMPPGQRLLRFEIIVDGTTKLEGHRGVVDSMPVDRMWNELETVSFEPPDSITLDIDADNPNRLTFAGDVIVSIKHVDRELSSVPLDRLAFRFDAASGTWSLNREEVERVQSAKP